MVVWVVPIPSLKWSPATDTYGWGCALAYCVRSLARCWGVFIYSKSETFWWLWWGWSRLVASNSLTGLILSVKSGIIKVGSTLKVIKWLRENFRWDGWCHSADQLNLVWCVRHGAYLWSVKRWTTGWNIITSFLITSGTLLRGTKSSWDGFEL